MTEKADFLHKLRQEKVYSKYSFNEFDRTLRASGLYCERLGDISEFRFLLRELSEMLRGELIVFDGEIGNYQAKLERQRAIIPASLVLTKKSLRDLLKENNDVWGLKKYETCDLYAYYNSRTINHTDFAQTRGWRSVKTPRQLNPSLKRR